MILLALIVASAQPPVGAATSDEIWVPCDSRPLPRDPCVDLRNLFLSRHYPREALNRRQEGSVGYRVRVDRYGNVTNCTVTQSSGVASLDARTCLVMLRRVVYHPAKDENGRTVVGIDTGVVNWRHPQAVAAAEAR